MFKLFVFVAALPVIQWVADALKAALPHGGAARWAWPFLVHYLLNLSLLAGFDHEPLKQAFGAAFVLTWLVRTFYLLKRL